MTETTNIAKALAKAQSEMGGAKKSATNPHFKKKYADLESVIDACGPALNKNGIAFIQPYGRDEYGDFCDTIFIHESGEQLSSRIYLVVDKQNMQGIGSAQTYARRYGLMGLAGIAPEDDDGNAAAASPPKQPSADEIKAAVAAIEILESMDELQSHWVMLNNGFHAIAAHKDVIAAKETRKAELGKATQSGVDLDGDVIPY